MKSILCISRFAIVAVLVIAGPLASAQHGTVNTAGTGTAGVQIESDAAFPDIVVKTGNATTSTFRVFNLSNVELLRVSANGNVAIGTATPTARLTVFGDTHGVAALQVEQRSTYSTNAAIYTVAGGSSALPTVSSGVTNSASAAGHSGIAQLQGAGTLGSATGLFAEAGVAPGHTGSVTTAHGVYARVLKNSGTVVTGHGIFVADVVATNDYGIYQAGADDSNFFSGNVTIGVPNAPDPGVKLSVSGDLFVSGKLTSPTSGSFSVGGTAPSGYPFFATSAAAGASAAVQLHSNFASHATSFVGNFGMYGTHLSQNRDPQNGIFTDAAAAPNQANAVDLAIGDTSPGRNRLFSLANFPGGTETVRMVVKYNGNVGIGSTAAALDPQERLVVDGNVSVSGSITGASVIGATYQDLAEWVPASSDMEPGTVVVLNHDRTNEVMPSNRAYDTSVAGVVSAQPGIILGVGSDSKEQIATTGRVKVRVDATQGPVRVGDLLVTSDKPGYAMKSIPVDIAGISMHRPGTIVGKALESLATGEGEILVLLSLQ